jgi:hypothetical protein
MLTSWTISAHHFNTFVRHKNSLYNSFFSPPRHQRLKDDSQEALCICFRCRGIYAFDGQELHKLSNGKQATKVLLT